MRRSCILCTSASGFISCRKSSTSGYRSGNARRIVGSMLFEADGTKPNASGPTSPFPTRRTIETDPSTCTGGSEHPGGVAFAQPRRDRT